MLNGPRYKMSIQNQHTISFISESKTLKFVVLIERSYNNELEPYQVVYKSQPFPPRSLWSSL